MANGQAVEEFGLGFRELFRIVVPGIYSAGLVMLVGRHFDGVKEMSSSPTQALTIVLALGLGLYGLEVHRSMPGYKGFFLRELVS